jgi:ribosomal protein S27AE
MEVNREGILKRKVACPNCGRTVSLKFLASRHECVRKKRGPYVHTRREKDPKELEEWAAEVERKAMNTFLRRVADLDSASAV